MKLKKIFRKHHKWFALSVTIIICAALLMADPTFAWLSNSDSKNNDMHLANLQGEIDGTANNDITQGELLMQNVSVTNTGNSPAFVRVLVLPVCVIDGVSWEIEFGVDKTGHDKQLKVKFDSNWIYCPKDGYCYYTKKIMPGETSDAVFTEVELKELLGTGVDGESFSFEFKAEFVGTTQYAYRIAWWNDKISDEQIPLDEEDDLYDVDEKLALLVQQ